MKKILLLLPAIAAMIILATVLVSHKIQQKNQPKAKRIFEKSSILVKDYCNGILPVDFDEDAILFSVYKDGKLKDSVKAKKLVKDLKQFREENQVWGHCFVGYILSVFEDGLVLDMFSDLKWYDFKSKEFHSSSKTETAAKIDKLCLAELDELLSATLPLVQDKKDREIILQIQDSVHSGSHENLKYKYTNAYLKGAHENMIKARYYYEKDSNTIKLFILD
ncbi:MAG: hypothetical protein J6W63_04560, partial [Treponema sp.]|nr:hypothetical protein [Treponema sp.]